MTEKTLVVGSTVALPKPELDFLLSDLNKDGFETVGPHLQDEGIVYKKINSLTDLPKGILTEQESASFRMVQTGKDRYFDFIPGSQSWKQFLFPPRQYLFGAKKDGKWKLNAEDETIPRYALIGVRACELAAIHVQDKIFLRPDFSDPVYRRRRDGLFILAVNCLDPDRTCFCTSLGTGPRVSAGFDLCITELDDVFLIEVGSELGRSFLLPRAYDLPSGFMQNNAKQAMERAAGSMVRSLDASDLPDLLTAHLETERWTEIGKRCLSCANCTQVCPTCFCWDVTDTVNILGRETYRERVWDSCFNPLYSSVFGGNTRPTIRARYRQWLTHKLGQWPAQFDVFGCVGCGRCITWCPAGIDLTEEIAAIRTEVKP